MGVGERPHAAPNEIDILGYHFEGGERWPRDEGLAKLKDTIRAQTRRAHGDPLPKIIASSDRAPRGWFEYLEPSRGWIFPGLDGLIRRRLRGILQERAERRGTGHGLADQRWPNAFFAAQGHFSPERAHAEARQPSRR